ncbi:MAG: cupin domain-containing protein [Ignavibacteria bacterium]|nr:cupin domain-containing protein [Ignavibacteria bacterium]
MRYQIIHSMKGNIYDLTNYIYNPLEEHFEELHSTNHLKIERIISKGHHSPDNYWYDQDFFEWVILLKGKAVLTLKNPNESIELSEGDYILIEPNRPHRVESTEPEKETFWLTISFK